MKRQLLAAVFATAVLANAAVAQGFMSTDRLGYTGTVTRYASQADALSRQNGIFTSEALQRDISFFFIDNNAAFAGNGNPPSTAWLATAWFFNNGENPNNVSQGFIQLADNEGATLVSQTQQWLDPQRTVFGFTATGGNSIPGCPNGSPSVPNGHCGRLWNGSPDAVLSPEQFGSFYEYAIGFVAEGLTPATWNEELGVWYSQSDPTSITGYFSGTFENTSDSHSNGWYSFDYQLNLNSYSYDNNFDLYPTEFGAFEESATPEPASLVLIATGLLGVAALRRKRRA